MSIARVEGRSTERALIRFSLRARLPWRPRIWLVALCALAPSSTTAVGQVALPFATTSDGFVLIPATVGDTRSIHVILDTGAGVDILAPSLVRALHGRPAGQFTGFRMQGDRIDIPLFVIPKLSVGPVVETDAVVGSWDVLDSLHIDGIVSANDFRRQPLTFDFVDRRVVFETQQSLAARRAAGVTSPIQLDDLRGSSLGLFARFMIGDAPAQCEIDTGSPATTVNVRYMKLLGIAEDGPSVRKHETHPRVGAPHVSYSATVPRIALAEAPDRGAANPKVAFSDIIYDCVLGIDHWAGKIVSVDIPDRQLILAPSPDEN
jgi:hypothetical protein